MGNEQAPIAPEVDLVALAQAEIAIKGEDYYFDKYGLGADELLVIVEYGEYSGPLIGAIDDSYDPVRDAHRKRCPVGGDMQQAFQKKGIEGVQKKLSALNDLAGTKIDIHGNEVDKFQVIISESTRQRVSARQEEKKKTMRTS